MTSLLSLTANKEKHGREKKKNVVLQQKRTNIFLIQPNSLLLLTSCRRPKHNNSCLLTLLRGSGGNQKHMGRITKPQKTPSSFPETRRELSVFIRASTPRPESNLLKPENNVLEVSEVCLHSRYQKHKTPKQKPLMEQASDPPAYSSFQMYAL